MEPERRKKATRGLEKRIGFGILLVIVGALLLLSNFHMLPYEIKHYLFTWEMILIGIGIISLLTNEHKIPGVILIAVGAFFWLPGVFDLDYSFRQLFWPLVIVFIGLLVIFRSRKHQSPFADMGDVKLTDDHIDEVNIFGGGERNVTSRNFQGGRITSVFGGSNLDFSDAELAPGKHVIDVFFLFGGSKFIFPSDWKIKTDVVSVFGGFSDKRKNVVVENGDDKILIIKGMAIFGGGEITNYR